MPTELGSMCIWSPSSYYWRTSHWLLFWPCSRAMERGKSRRRRPFLWGWRIHLIRIYPRPSAGASPLPPKHFLEGKTNHGLSGNAPHNLPWMNENCWGWMWFVDGWSSNNAPFRRVDRIRLKPVNDHNSLAVIRGSLEVLALRHSRDDTYHLFRSHMVAKKEKKPYGFKRNAGNL